MLDPSRVAPAPWRNGAGATRELATGTDASGRVLWRISVADLDRDAPFSTFPGLDRLFIALGPLRLTVDGRQQRLAAGDQARFAGEAPVTVALDTPIRALNVMTRRGACRAEVILRPAAAPRLPADATVLLDELVPRQTTFAPSRRPARSPTASRAWEGPPLAAPAESPSTSSTRASGRHAESTHRTPLLDGQTLPAGALAADVRLFKEPDD